MGIQDARATLLCFPTKGKEPHEAHSPLLRARGAGECTFYALDAMPTVVAAGGQQFLGNPTRLNLFARSRAVARRMARDTAGVLHRAGGVVVIAFDRSALVPDEKQRTQVRRSTVSTLADARQALARMDLRACLAHPDGSPVPDEMRQLNNPSGTLFRAALRTRGWRDVIRYLVVYYMLEELVRAGAAGIGAAFIVSDTCLRPPELPPDAHDSAFPDLLLPGDAARVWSVADNQRVQLWQEDLPPLGEAELLICALAAQALLSGEHMMTLVNTIDTDVLPCLLLSPETLCAHLETVAAADLLWHNPHKGGAHTGGPFTLSLRGLLDVYGYDNPVRRHLHALLLALRPNDYVHPAEDFDGQLKGLGPVTIRAILAAAFERAPASLGMSPLGDSAFDLDTRALCVEHTAFAQFLTPPPPPPGGRAAWRRVSLPDRTHPGWNVVAWVLTYWASATDWGVAHTFISPPPSPVLPTGPVYNPSTESSFFPPNCPLSTNSNGSAGSSVGTSRSGGASPPK